MAVTAAWRRRVLFGPAPYPFDHACHEVEEVLQGIGRDLIGDDGGAEITVNGGQTWTTEDNQPTAEIYRVITDDRFPYWVYGAQQEIPQKADKIAQEH
jgi:hypothetical protein